MTAKLGARKTTAESRLAQIAKLTRENRFLQNTLRAREDELETLKHELWVLKKEEKRS